MNYLLVHGAWHGAWCWERVAVGLRGAGHAVRAPTLSGLGERSAELSPEIGLGTHVAEIAQLLEDLEPPDEQVVVGHSYGALVVREAVDRAKVPVRRLITIDGWSGATGDSLLSLSPDWFAAGIRKLADEQGDGWRIPPPDPALVGIEEPTTAALVAKRMTPQPIKTFAEETRLSEAVRNVSGAAILCTRSTGLPFAELARAAGYPATHLDTGHDAMVTAPDELAALLGALG